MIFCELKRDRFLKGLTADEFSQKAAYYLSEINMIHPFREGNGRTIREFIRQLALKCGHIINWSLIDKEKLLEAINFPSMTDLDHNNDKFIIPDLINYTIDSLTHTVSLLGREFITTGRSWVVTQRFNTLKDSFDIFIRQVPEILGHGLLKANLKACHRL